MLRDSFEGPPSHGSEEQVEADQFEPSLPQYRSTGRITPFVDMQKDENLEVRRE